LYCETQQFNRDFVANSAESWYGGTERRLNSEVRTDEVLMAQVCQGHDNALAELVGRYQNDIFRFCLHYLHSVDAAKDMAQETFVRVFAARQRFDASRTFRPWLLCIARNLCLNELKRKKTVSMETLEEYASASRADTGEIFRFSGDGPDERLMADERLALLSRALDGLNQESRELIMLRYFERLSAREIGDMTGSSEGAVRTKIHRILGSLRQKWASSKEDL